MSPMLSGEVLSRAQREAREAGLRVFPDWAALSREQRRGLVFALRANGNTLEEVAATVGLSREYTRQVLFLTQRRIERTADRWQASGRPHPGRKGRG